MTKRVMAIGLASLLMAATASEAHAGILHIVNGDYRGSVSEVGPSGGTPTTLASGF
jgi:hypothetical protein